MDDEDDDDDDEEDEEAEDMGNVRYLFISPHKNVWILINFKLAS